VNGDLMREIEQFLYREARLLDERKHEEWLSLFTDDLRYWMPVVSTQERGGQEVAGPNEIAYFDDNRQTLSLRVKRLSTGLAFAEEPPSRTRRFISNVEIRSESEQEVVVLSNFIVYRTRLERDQDLFVGHREDLLRRVDGGWKIASRKMVLDQNVLAAKNLSIFF
jgi:3-phenylpropionate/cinnamic acid dioxygenase small subunit